MYMRRAAQPNAVSFHAVTRAAWSEFKVAADYSTGMGEVMRGTERPPRGFVGEELGFGLGNGPSLLFTMAKVQQKSRRRRSGREWQRVLREAVDVARKSAKAA
jgi:hypothetical protein